MRLHGVLGKLSVAQGWTREKSWSGWLEALIAWVSLCVPRPPGFTAIGWA
jgi:hypothetical protein